MHWSDAFSPYAGGKKAAVGALTDDALGKRLRTYKRQVAKRYRVIDPEQIERMLGGGGNTYAISTKLDGELWFLVKRGGEVALCAFNGRVIRETPLCKEAEARLEGAPDVIIAGELVSHPPSESGRARVHHVATALGSDELEETLSFHAFDLLDDGDSDMLLTDYGPRLERLQALVGGGGRVTVVETQEGDAAAVTRLYREWVVGGRFEGVVVRTERGLTYKIKSTLTLDAVIIAFGERITGEVHQVREMSVAVLRDDGHYQLLGAVGNGFSEQDRAAWHSRLAPDEVPSRFRLANREGTLSKFVKPSIVVEIRCSDLLAADSWDAPIRRMSLRYSETEGWAPVAETPTAVMIHPIFLRERADKTVSPEDVSMAQITAHVPIAQPHASATLTPQKPAEVVRRAVFSKVTKGVVAVRKYAIIDTHKADDRNYPALAVFFTDYSPGRKEPLKTSLRSASSMERAEGIASAWLVDNIKRGWGEVESGRVGDLVPTAGSVEAQLKKAPAKKAPAKKAAKKTPAKKAPAKKD